MNSSLHQILHFHYKNYQLYHPQTNPDGYFECPQWHDNDSDINCDEIDTSQWGSYREHALLKNDKDRKLIIFVFFFEKNTKNN